MPSHSLSRCVDGKSASCTKPVKIALFRRLDRAWLVIAAIFFGIAISVPSFFLSSIAFTVQNYFSILPYLLLSAGLAGYMQAAGADKLIGRVLVNRVGIAIGSAAIFGSLSPFCSCGVIPLIAALLLAGTPLSAVMAFWVASPIMSPSMFILTVGGLGIEFALVKTLAAISLGLFAGYLTLALQRLGYFKDYLNNRISKDCSSCSIDIAQYSEAPLWHIWRERSRLSIFRQKALSMIYFLSKWLVLAFVLESLMVAYLPPIVLAQWLGQDSIWAIPLAAIIGIPAYLNGFAAVPVVAGLMESGMTPGAALSFMLAGSITSIPAAIAVFSLVKRSLFIWYLVLALLGAMMAGWIYQFGLFYL